VRIQKGQEILLLDIRSEADLNEVYAKKEKWHKLNLEYLKHCFDVDSIAQDYDFSGSVSVVMYASLGQQIESLRNSVQSLINELESINERLSVFQEKL